MTNHRRVLAICIWAAALLAMPTTFIASQPSTIIDLANLDNPPPGVLILRPQHDLDLDGEMWVQQPARRSESKRAAFGDFDGDGLTDIAVGVPSQHRGAEAEGGHAYIVFGRREFQSLPAAQRVLHLRDTDLHLDPGDADVVIRRHELDDWLGYCVAAGDLNGDGYDDLVLTAPRADPQNFFQDPEADGRVDGGVLYILFGSPSLRSPTSSPTEINLAPVLGAVPLDPADPCRDTVTGVASFTSLPVGVRAKAILGANHSDAVGISVACGDVNSDGFADVIVSAAGISDPAQCYGGLEDGGAVWAVFGSVNLDDDQVYCPNLGTHRPVNKIIELGSCDALMTTGHALFAGRGAYKERFGASVATGDVNGDGIADIVLGTPMWGAHIDYPSGKAYVVYGSPTLPGSYMDFRDLQAPTVPTSLMYGITMIHDGSSVTQHYSFGAAVAVGDVNGDGVDDIAVGAPGRKGNNLPGKAFVAFSIPTEPGLAEKPGVPILGGTILNVANDEIVRAVHGTSSDPGTDGDQGDQTGASLGMSDLEGTGLDEVWVGSPAAARPGTTDYAGRLSRFPQTVLDLATGGTVTLDSASAWVIGSLLKNHLGGAISATGDLDDDGFPDAAFIATGNASGGTVDWRPGYIAVVFGGGARAGEGSIPPAARPRYSPMGDCPTTRFGPTLRASVNWQGGTGIVYDPGPNPPQTGSIGTGPSFDLFEIDREIVAPPTIPTITLDTAEVQETANTMWHFISTRSEGLPMASLEEPLLAMEGSG